MTGRCVRNGQLDVAFLIVPPGKSYGPDLTCYKFLDNELFLIVNQADPLSGLTAVDLAGLSGRSIVTPGSASRPIVREFVDYVLNRNM